MTRKAILYTREDIRIAGVHHKRAIGFYHSASIPGTCRHLSGPLLACSFLPTVAWETIIGSQLLNSMLGTLLSLPSPFWDSDWMMILVQDLGWPFTLPPGLGDTVGEIEQRATRETGIVACVCTGIMGDCTIICEDPSAYAVLEHRGPMDHSRRGHKKWSSFEYPLNSTPIPVGDQTRNSKS